MNSNKEITSEFFIPELFRKNNYPYPRSDNFSYFTPEYVLSAVPIFTKYMPVYNLTYYSKIKIDVKILQSIKNK